LGAEWGQIGTKNVNDSDKDSSEKLLYMHGFHAQKADSLSKYVMLLHF